MWDQKTKQMDKWSQKGQRGRKKGWSRKGKERKEKSKLTVLQVTSAVIKGSIHQGN